MHLLRELILALVCGVAALWIPGWLAGVAPRVEFFLSGVTYALPFQAAYGIALLAARRAGAGTLGLLGALAWAALAAPLLGMPAPGGGVPGPVPLLWLQAAVPLLLAVAAAWRQRRGNWPRALAGALYAWCFTRWAAGWALLGLASGASDLNRLALLLAGSLYLTLCLAAGIAYPLQGDPWFRREKA